jgi:hypothetical protein
VVGDHLQDVFQVKLAVDRLLHALVYLQLAAAGVQSLLLEADALLQRGDYSRWIWVGSGWHVSIIGGFSPL